MTDHDGQGSPYLELLKNRINLQHIPFTERGSRILVHSLETGLIVRLAERWIKRDHRLSAYRERVPLLEQIQFADSNGNPLPVSLETYPHCILLQTPQGIFKIFFADAETLQISFPPGRFRLQFLAHMDQHFNDRRGGILRLTGNVRRNVAYTTDAQILKNYTTLVQEELLFIYLEFEAQEGQSLLLNITPRLGFNRYISAPEEVLARSAHRWHEWFAAAPVTSLYTDTYYYAWWVMRAGLISTRFFTTREAMTPSKEYYVGVWQWDSLFHALAYRHIDQRLAQDQLRIIIDHQCEDGMFPDAIHDEGLVTHLEKPVDADVTKPPIIAWAAWKMHQHHADLEFLNEIYEPLVRWNNWWLENNDLDHDGLCEYQHPFSSGMDDNPFWDQGMPVVSPDLNTYLVIQQENLGRIARAIGDFSGANLWEKRTQAMAQQMKNKLWDAESGYFWGYRLDGERIPTRSLINLYPLMCPQMGRPIHQALLNHLTNRDEFWSPYPLPTVALDDPAFNPNQMWRGPTWVNTNYLMIEGLQRNGFQEYARQLRKSTLDMIAAQDDIYEYYNPIDGSNPPKAAAIFGWSAALFIDLVIQANQGQEKS